MKSLTDFLQKHEENLSADSRESLLASLGSLVSQADMIVYIEGIPLAERSQKQIQLLKEMRDGAQMMTDMVKEVLHFFAQPKPLQDKTRNFAE